MADPEMSMEAISARHTYADGPSESLEGLKRINLVYSGMGKQAHDDRGALLAEIERLRGKLNNLSNAAAIVYAAFKPISGPDETAKALLKMELGLKD